MEAPILSDEDLRQFAERGYVRITDALPADFVKRVRDFLWEQARERAGIVRDEPSTWTTQWFGVNKDAIDRAARMEIGPRLAGAANQIFGVGQWRPFKTLGGLLYSFPDVAPDKWEIATRLWHTDHDTRIPNASSDAMLFTFFSSVRPHGGGTLILSGSHKLFEKFHAVMPDNPGKDAFADWHPYLSQLMGRMPRTLTTADFMDAPTEIHGVNVQVEELTGEQGDAILCHPAILHCTSRNAADTPRIMRRTNFRRKK